MLYKEQEKLSSLCDPKPLVVWRHLAGNSEELSGGGPRQSRSNPGGNHHRVGSASQNYFSWLGQLSTMLSSMNAILWIWMMKVKWG